MANDQALAKGLGWFSIGLGLAQIASPQGVNRLIGVRDDEDNRNLMRGIGLRELTAGFGILSKQRPSGWLWARVAGDAMDLSLLGKALTSDDAQHGRVAAAAAAVAGITALDLYSSLQLSENGVEANGQSMGTSASADGVLAKEKAPRGEINVSKRMTINKTPDEVYRFWRNLENLPQFMKHLESVTVAEDGKSHWTATAPAGKTVEWDAEITEDRPGELISWRSVEGSEIPNWGTVRFVEAPQGRGTEVHVHLVYSPPGGKLGALVATLFMQEPNIQVQEDLRRFKQIMELGEIVRSDASLEGPLTDSRPAQPAPSV
jgi:uncharacterized membrane protein